MKLRTLSALGALLLALAVSGEASAQQYRVAQDAYRGGPSVEDDEDYPGASRSTYGRPVPRASVGQYEQDGVYQPRRDPSYRDQGYTGSVPPQEAYRAPLPAPGEPAQGGYAQQPPQGAYAAPAQRPYEAAPPRGYENQASRPYDGRPYEEPPQQYGRPQERPQEYGRAYDPQNRMAPPVDLSARQPGPPGAQQPRDPRDPANARREQGPRDAAPSQAEVEAVQNGKIEDMDPRFRRRVVDYKTKEPVGTLIVDTTNTYLYLVMADGKAMRYGIGVGREGFTWAGRQKISRMKEWPDWYPPAEMIERQPYLPRWMAGGPSNPMGARALYLGNTLYRIHGTNDPTTIGKFVSSGCIRLFNADVEDLYSRVQMGTNVVVLKKEGGIPTQLAPERLPGQPEAAQAPVPNQGSANMTPRPRSGFAAR